jgi:hypothetical protein
LIGLSFPPAEFRMLEADLNKGGHYGREGKRTD